MKAESYLSVKTAHCSTIHTPNSLSRRLRWMMKTTMERTEEKTMKGMKIDDRWESD